MSTTAIGQSAEAAAAQCLKDRGYKIIDMNWRNRLCEIDVIARMDKVVYFVEVKYRASSSQGSGFEYITPKKLSQMKFAGRLWNQNNKWDGDWRLLAAEVSGLSFENISLLEIT